MILGNQHQSITTDIIVYFFNDNEIIKKLPAQPKISITIRIMGKNYYGKAYPTKIAYILCTPNELTPDLIYICKTLKNVSKNLVFY